MYLLKIYIGRYIIQVPSVLSTYGSFFENFNLHKLHLERFIKILKIINV